MQNINEGNVCLETQKSRAVKRTKSCPKLRQVRPKKSSLFASEILSLKRVRSCEDVKALRAGYWTAVPPLRPLGDFNELPIEVIYIVLEYLPIGSISQLALSSKSFRDVLIEWMDTVRPHSRLIPHFQRCAQMQWILPCLALDGQPSTLPFPNDFCHNCQQIGGLLKRLTCLFPTHRRLGIFKHFIDSMGRLVQKKLTGKSTDHLTRAASGIILHKLIAGWDHHECVKVFTNLGQTYNLHAMLNRFFDRPVGSSRQMERFLRLHLRTLFLDFCVRNDRSIWVSIIFDPVKRTHSQVAQLLILLYAPIQQEGNINWNFIDEEAGNHSYSYEIMADTLTRLPNPHNFLTSLMGTPRMWQYRAKAALFIYLEKKGSQLILEYFRQLSMIHDTQSAVWMLAEITNVSRGMRHYLQQSSDYVIVNAHIVLNIFRLALNYGWEQIERNFIIEETWRVIEQMSRMLFEEFLITGCDEQLLLFLNTLKDISIRLSY